MTNITTLEKNKCNGCSACCNVCPSNAITMQKNNEGFLYPFIDEDKCTNCGLCYKSCPAVNSLHDNYKSPECYVVHSDDQIREKSASGGIFPVIANFFLENGGYVSGAVWTDDMHVEHIISNKIEDVEKMKNSKYLQSDISNCYKEIKKLLDDNKQILFTGTPCQVDGLRLYLQKDYENLFCVSIICHGVPSRKVFEKYIKEEKLFGEDEKWLNTNFRDKINGWNPYLITTSTTTSTTSDFAQNDSYMQAFLKNLSLRKSCTKCVHRTIPVSADLTIGDAWEIDNYDKTLNDGKGLSVLMINDKKGRNLFQKINQKFNLCKNVPLEFVLQGNPILKYSNLTDNPDRKLFFELLDKKTLKENIDVCLNDKCDYLIVNFGWSWFNYGAVLTAYALQELLKSLGFITKNLLTFDIDEKVSNRNFSKFQEKYLNFTQNITLSEAHKLTKNVKGVILGSDQVLRCKYIKNYNYRKYLLDFVDNDCKKLAISASFGLNEDEFEKDNDTKKYLSKMQNSLKSFDYLSTREISGINILNKYFGINADVIIDPVFLINKEKYFNLIKDSKKDFSDNVVTYVLDKNDKYFGACNYLQHKYNYNLSELDYNKDSISDWLKAIHDCKFFLTDSFHGVCFALIFNKPFICVRNAHRGDVRFKSLIDTFCVEQNFISDIDEIYAKEINPIPNYEKINEILTEEKDRCLKIIQKVLCENYSNNPMAKKYKKILDINLTLRTNIFKYFINYINYKKYKYLYKHGNPLKKEHYLKKLNKWKRKTKDIKYAK